MRFVKQLVASVVVGGCILYMAWKGFPASPADLSTIPVPDGWSALVHLTSNAMVPWKEDPLMALIATMVGASPDVINLAIPTTYFWVSSSVFLLTLVACALVLGLSACSAVLLALSIVAIVLLLLGAEQGALAALAWWPALLCCVLGSVIPRAQRKNIQQGPLIVLALFFSYRMAVAGGALSLVLVLVALGTPFFLGYKLRSPKLWSLAVLLPAVLVTMMLPAVEFPDYPPEARVIADDGLPGIVRPLSGPDLPISVIDRNIVREELVGVSLALMLLGVMAGWGGPRSRRYVWIASVCCALTAFLDAAPSEFVSLVMPLESLGRLGPGLFLHFLPPLMIVVAAVYLLLYLALRDQWFAISGLVLTTVVVWRFATIGSGIPHGILERPRVHVLTEVFALPECKESKAASQRCRNVLASPSLAVLANYGAAVLTSEYAQSNRVSRGPGKIVAASTNIDKIGLASDKDLSTRWFSASLPHGEDAWLLIRKPQSQPAIGLALETGAFASDFPGGLAVYVRKESGNCDPSSVRTSTWSPIFRTNDWQGPVKLSPLGYPYYQGQPDVEIPFERAVHGNCFLVRQTKQRAIFDWSVAEAKFLFARKRQAPILNNPPKQSIVLHSSVTNRS